MFKWEEVERSADHSDQDKDIIEDKVNQVKVEDKVNQVKVEDTVYQNEAKRRHSREERNSWLRLQYTECTELADSTRVQQQ